MRSGFTTIATATATGGEAVTGTSPAAAFATAGAVGDIGKISATATSSVSGSSALVTEIEAQGDAFANGSNVLGVAQTGFAEARRASNPPTRRSPSEWQLRRLRRSAPFRKGASTEAPARAALIPDKICYQE